MQGLIPLILAGLIFYLLFVRRGGMGCCGGHMAHEPKESQNKHRGILSENSRVDVIDLRDDEYTILPPEGDKMHQGQLK